MKDLCWALYEIFMYDNLLLYSIGLHRHMFNMSVSCVCVCVCVQVCSFGYIVVRYDGVVTSSEFYVGEDALKVFFMKLEEEEEKIKEELATPAVLNLTPEEETEFQQAEVSTYLRVCT